MEKLVNEGYELTDEILDDMFKDESDVATEAIGEYAGLMVILGTYAAFFTLLGSMAYTIENMARPGKVAYDYLLQGQTDRAKVLYNKLFNNKNASFIVNKRAYDASTVLLRKYEQRGIDAWRDINRINDLLEDLVKNRKKYTSGKGDISKIKAAFEKLVYAEQNLQPITDDDIKAITGLADFGPKDPSMEIDRKYLEERIDFARGCKNLDALTKFINKAPDPEKWQLTVSYRKKNDAYDTFDDRFDTLDPKAAYLKTIYRMREYLIEAGKVYTAVLFFRFMVLAHVQ